MSEVIAVEELLTATAASSFTTTELFSRPLRTDPLRWTGNVPVRAGRLLEDAGYDLRALLDTAWGT